MRHLGRRAAMSIAVLALAVSQSVTAQSGPSREEKAEAPKQANEEAAQKKEQDESFRRSFCPISC